MTLVVNLFGGPGVSKSTTTALVYGKLKLDGLNVEIASEYAKDLTWEGRKMAIMYQPYVAAKQIFRVHRLLGQVDAVITDSPILLSSIYRGEGYSPAFEAFLLDTFNSWETLNIRLIRNTKNHPYLAKGRHQSEEQAREVDAQILRMLLHHGIPTTNIEVGEGETTADHITGLVKKQLSLHRELVAPWTTS